MVEKRTTRRSLLTGLLVCLSVSGCARVRSWAWRDIGARPDPRQNNGAREQTQFVNKLHEQAFGIRNGLIDPNQVP